MLGSDGHISGLRTHPQTPQSARLIATTVSVAVRFVDRPRRAETLSDLPKKPVPKISTWSRRRPAAPGPRPAAATSYQRLKPLVASAARSSPQNTRSALFGRPPQQRPKQRWPWPRRRPSRYGSAAAPPSASRRKRGARSRAAPRDHARKATVLGARKNAPSSSSRRPGSRMRINPVYRDSEKYHGRRRRVGRDFE